MSRDNSFLPLAVAGALALQLAGVYVPPLRDLLGTEPLPASDLGIAGLAAIAGFVLARLGRERRRRSNG